MNEPGQHYDFNYQDGYRDYQIMLFLWEHKVSSTAVLCEKFFSNIKQRTALNSLNRIRKRKLMQARMSDNENDRL